MCHEHHISESVRERHEPEDETEEEQEELPSFLNEEASGGTEVLTDGGDES